MQVNSFPPSVPLQTRLSFMADRAKRLLSGVCAKVQQDEFDALALVPIVPMGEIAEQVRDAKGDPFFLNRG